MKMIFSTLAVAAALAMCGCSSMKSAVGYDKNTDFAALKSYAWIPYPPVQRADPRLNYDFLDKTIRASVNDGLQKKGMRLATDAHPDFRVRWYVAVNEEVSDTQINTFFDFVGAAGVGYDADGQWVYTSPSYGGTQQKYAVGSVVLDFVNAKTGKLVWRGAAQSVVDEKASKERRRELIDQAVHKILEQYPPSLKKK